jgi:hypothetical protein
MCIGDGPDDRQTEAMTLIAVVGPPGAPVERLNELFELPGQDEWAGIPHTQYGPS